MAKFQAVLGSICKKFAYIAMVITFILVFITTIDVILRKVSSLSILGSYEMTEMGMVIVVFFSVALLQTKKGHVRVDMLLNKFPERARAAVDGAMHAVGAFIIVLMSYAGFIQMLKQFHTGTTTAVLFMPLFPFYLFMGIGLVLFAIVLVTDAIAYFMQAAGKYKPLAAEN